MSGVVGEDQGMMLLAGWRRLVVRTAVSATITSEARTGAPPPRP